MEYAASIIHRLEHGKGVFSPDERNLIVNYGYKLDDYEKTKELADMLAYRIENEPANAALTVIDAQAEIDALPDGMIGLSEMHGYGYTWEEMLPLTKETALELFDRDLAVYQLHKDGSETLIEDKEQITGHEGIFGIEKSDWENERELRSMQAELAESGANKQAQLLYGSSDKYGIYQLKDNPELRDFHFAGTESLKRRGIIKDNLDAIKPENYNLVYVGELSELSKDFIRLQTQGDKLEALYEKFNIDHPADYKGHSLSVSDIVVLHENGKNSAHFVDSVGFTMLPDFLREIEGIKEQEADKAEKGLTDEEKQFLETDNAPLIAKNFLAWDEIEDLGYRFFEDGYIDKFKPVEKALFGDGLVSDDTIHDIARRMQGGEDIREELAKALIGGHERVIEADENDGVAVLFGRDAVTVAFGNAEKQISYEEMGTAFLGLMESEYKKIEQVRAADGQEEEIAESATSGHNVQKLETEQSEPEKPAEAPKFEDMEEGDEIIDLGDETDQVLAEMKQSLEGRQDTSGHDVNLSARQKDLKLETEPEEMAETELAFQIADRFISIQETDGGYDYSIMGTDYKEIDGGVYDNPDVSIREALNNIVEDLRENPFDNGAGGNIGDDDELIPIDYDGLMEKVEAANRIEPQAQGNVVENFKAKTNELFHEISEMNPAEIEEAVKRHVQAKIDEYAIQAEIIDVAVVGSRCRGLEREGSDLDVAVELSTNEREDVLFDTFNGDGLHIGGVKVDINPITAQRTGSLETYLPQVEDYLEGVREAREKEPVSIFNIRMNDEERWFKNTSGLDAEGLCKAYAECDKPFVEMGKYGEWIKAADHASIEQGDRLDFSIEFNEETDQITIFDGENFTYKGLRETLFPEQAEPEVTLTVAECGEFHTMGEFYENIPTVEEAVTIWKQIPSERMNGIPAIGINIHTPGTEVFEDVGIDILSGKRIDLDILEFIPDIKNSPQAMEVIAELVAKAMPLMPEMEIDGNMGEEFEAKVWEKRMPDLTPAQQLAVELDRFTYDYDTAVYHDNSQSMTENVSELADALKQGDTQHMH
ncbi:YodL domain-containing protein [Bacteroides acidifaciens]|uniref:YodL domain-containing protein n=1 Tax=Bacteroides acidifaciens TaxID=85831 RepID=UPI0030151F77